MFSANDVLIECVPNFSEGRRKDVIDTIADEIRNTDYVQLLHIDIGYDANRTVYTFVGKPEYVIDAAFRAIQKAALLIDMQEHKGKHPRMGACDVCPLIPLQNCSMEEVILLSKQLAGKVGNVGIPVYLYESSATNEDRKKLEYIRKGEYESIPQKLELEQWKPDFGPFSFNKKFGMMAIGARDFLIAYNINFNTKDLSIGKQIAAQIRYKRDVEKDEKLQFIKAIAWFIEEYNFVQLSTNITNFKSSSLFYVFDVVNKLAKDNGIEVNGSELIGLIPKDALLKDNPSPEFKTDDAKINFAIHYLGLDKVFEFDKNKRIIDYMIQIED